MTAAALTGCVESAEPEPARLPLWELAVEVRIDGYEHDLTPIPHFGVSEDGTIAIAQWQDKNVRLFGGNGEPMGALGRAGSGPGEFQWPARVGWIGDTLWVVDSQLSRITPMTARGELLRTTPSLVGDPKDVAELGPMSPRTLNPDGSISAFGSRSMNEISPQWAGAGSTNVAQAVSSEGGAYARLHTDGALERVIARTWPSRSMWSLQLPGGVAGGHYPFANLTRHEIADDGRRLALAFVDLEGPDVGTFRAVMLDTSGDTLYDRRYPFEAVPLPRAVADSAVAADIARWRLFAGRFGSGFAAELARSYSRDAYVPAIYPPLVGLIIGYDGTLWIRLRDTAAGRPYLILNEAGEAIGRALLPTNYEIRQANATHAWALELDDLDMQSIVRFRVER